MSSGKGMVILAVVALIAAPAFGAISMRVLVDGSPNAELQVGSTGTVSVEVTCDSGAGVLAAGGSVYGDVPGLESIPSSIEPGFGWWPWPPPPPPFEWWHPGWPGPNGGWECFGVSQNPLIPPDPSIGNGVWLELVRYRVDVVGDVCTYITLRPEMNTDPRILCTDTNGNVDIGAEIGAAVHIIPEPASLALLALGGAAAVRRRK